jgi:hypothetical protein
MAVKHEITYTPANTGLTWYSQSYKNW